MGAARSKATSSVRKGLQTTRSLEKVLDREKPSVAPRHKTTVDKIDSFIQAHPEIKEEQTKKDDSYLTMLNRLHVDSQDPERKPETRTKPLNPLLLKNRLPNDKLIEFFDARQKDPELWTEEKLAEKYDLNISLVKNLCAYYSAFQVKKTPPREPPLQKITF